MSELERIIAEVKELPEEGEGMTLGQIAAAVDTDTSTLILALEEMAEREAD